MKFTLIYDGALQSCGNHSKPEHVWEIRKQFDPQLRKLWQVNQDLANLKSFPQVRMDGHYIRTHPHHDSLASVAQSTAISSAIFRTDSALAAELGGSIEDADDIIDLCAPIVRGSMSFLPLVRDTLALKCGLKIQFLREGSSGRVYQGGDLDGRIKCLLDALSVPQHANQIPGDPDCPTPLYCLLEDDRLAAALQVETGELLTPAAARDSVHLSIEVDVRVTRARAYNEIFLAT